jgi:CHAT domain-containing protein
VGKGKRNRERRKSQVELGELIGQLVEVDSEEDFLALLAEHPQLLVSETINAVERRVDAGIDGLFLMRWHRLLQAARRDPSAAWADHLLFEDESAKSTERLEKLRDQLAAAEQAGDLKRVIELADEALPVAAVAELAPAVATFENARATAYLRLADGDRTENVEEAIASYRRALSASIDSEQEVGILMQLAIAFAERPQVDPADSLEEALQALRDALAYLPADASMDTRTTIQTNLASMLLRRERGEKIENLREALAYCEEVLEYRSRDRDPDQWAYIQLNYAPTLQQLAGLGEIDRAEAEAAYREVIEADETIAAPHLGNANYQLGRMLRIGTQFDAEEFVENWDPDHEEGPEAEAPAEEEARSARLQARRHLEDAIELHDEESEPLAVGRAYTELADVLQRLDLIPEAIEAARRGAQLLPPGTDPREATRVGGQLGHLLALEGEWEESAAAFKLAVEASELAFHTRLEFEGRVREARSALNLTRWAAFAIAAASDEPEAMMVLESGRSRDMRQRLGVGEADSVQIQALPTELRDAYLRALDELARSPLGEQGSRASRALQEALRDIRGVAGFEQFATRAHPADLVGALEPAWPLLYVDPTPYGTMLLLIEADPEGATADARFLSEPTALEVFLRLMAGEAAGAPELLESGDYGSYLSGASGFGAAERDIQKDVEHVLPWFGESIAKPVHDLLVEIEARGVTLVTCGPIGLAPLHAAPWEEDGEGHCLIDDFEIRHAPSGAFAAASLARAGEREELEPSLVALADPLGDLPAAVPEVETIRERFGGEATIATGTEADWDFLSAHAREGTHLHLACHARSAIWGERPPAVILADGDVDVSQLTELAELPARLVAVSACQSGVMDITHLPEEALSAGSVLLAAGAACVIASLWPVRDHTTALLMARIYEEMLEHGHRPPEALRRSQLWLRDLSEVEAADYLRRHPELEEEFRRRADAGDDPGQRAGVTRRGGTATETRPYSDPDYWAPFIALGA